jgi:hypothetical protein
MSDERATRARTTIMPLQAATRQWMPASTFATAPFKGFAPAVSYAPADEPLSIVAVDLTGNGHLDLVVGERSASGATSELLANTGNGNFALSKSYGASNNNVGNVVAADFNGDGKIDLASQSNGVNGIDLKTDNGVLGIDFGAGGGRFASQVVRYATPQTTGYLTAGDFNGDGHPDIAFAGHDYVDGGPVGGRRYVRRTGDLRRGRPGLGVRDRHRSGRLQWRRRDRHRGDDEQ